jgi:EmrB/QacA subfamily drug resistance transporter
MRPSRLPNQYVTELLTFGGFLLIGGRLADWLGPRRLFMASLAAFAGASALCGLAPSDGVLIATRGLQGIAGALLSPAALAILLATYPEGAGRRRALSAWAAMLGLGAAFGLVAGGALVELAGWRWIFLVNLPVAVMALTAATQVLPADDRSDARDAPNILGAALATVGLLLFVFTVVETHTEGWASARSLLGFAGAAVPLAAFAAVERRVASPLLPAELLRRPRAISADGVVFIAAGGLLAMFFFMTLYLQRVLGFSALQTGLAFLPFSAAMGIGSGLIGRMPHRFDPRIPIVIGIAAAAVGLWMMTRLGVTSDYAADMLPALGIVAAGLGAAFVPLMASRPATPRSATAASPPGS